MSIDDQLTLIWEEYLFSKASIKIAVKLVNDSWQPNKSECKSVIEAYQNHLLNNTKLKTYPRRYPIDKRRTEEKHDHLFVVALWATFERFLLDLLLSMGDVLEAHVQPSKLGSELCSFYKLKAERWTIDEILDLFVHSEILKANSAGDVKHVYNYRNEIAHGKSHTKRVKVQTTYNTLKTVADILKSAI